MPTLGEQRVVHNFNPESDNTVQNLKDSAASLIDYIDDIPNANNQTARWKAEAMTAIETGCMYAVKAATAGQVRDGGP